MDTAGSPSPQEGLQHPVKVFISYSHDNPEHMDRVLTLSNTLRTHGVDCEIDQYEMSPEDGWPIWCKKKIRESRFTLCVCTKTYFDRFEGNEPIGRGQGVKYEGFVIVQTFYADDAKNKKFIPVYFGDSCENVIPTELSGASRFQVDCSNGYEDLYRLLTDQPRISKPPLGQRRDLGASANQMFDGVLSMTPIGPALPQRERKHRFPPCFVPHLQNPFFTGRAAELAAIDTALKAEGRAAISQVHAISGLGGVGKTQTAVRYCYDHRDDYTAIFWLLAETPETLAADAAAVARELSLPEANAQDQDKAVQAVRRWLRGNTGWLLVLDNADTPEMVEACRAFLPAGAPGAVLITSRLDDLSELGIVAPIDMPTLPPDDAFSFLRQRCRRETLSPAEEQAAGDLADELGYLPLALEQAAAYIVATKCTFAEYLKAYRVAGLKLLQKGKVKAGDYKHTVATTWSMSIERVREECPAAVELLNMCSMLASAPIPVALIRDGGKEMGVIVATFLEKAGQLGANELLAPLVLYSLVKFDAAKDVFFVHRLVQAVTCFNLLPEEQRKYAGHDTQALDLAFPFVSFHSWPLCEIFAPHSFVCFKSIQRFKIVSEEAGRLLARYGVYLQCRGNYSLAESLFRWACNICEKLFSPLDLRVAGCYSNLSEALRSQCKYSEAEMFCVRALEIRQKVLRPEHPDVAASLTNLAALCSSQGDFAEAEKINLYILRTWGHFQGNSLYNKTHNLINTANILKSQGRFNEAKLYATKAIEVLEADFGDEHPDLAKALNILSLVLCSQGKIAEAFPLCRRSIKIRKKIFGPFHAEVGRSLHTLGLLLQANGDYKKSENVLRDALSMLESLGKCHLSVAKCLGCLGVTLYEQGAFDESEKVTRCSLKILEDIFEPDHPSLATYFNDLAIILEACGDVNQAELYWRRSLMIQQKNFGNAHPDTVRVIKNLASRLQKNGREAEAGRKAFEALNAPKDDSI